MFYRLPWFEGLSHLVPIMVVMEPTKAQLALFYNTLHIPRNLSPKSKGDLDPFKLMISTIMHKV